MAASIRACSRNWVPRSPDVRRRKPPGGAPAEHGGASLTAGAPAGRVRGAPSGDPRAGRTSAAPTGDSPAGRTSAALTVDTRAFLEQARRAHLATTSGRGAPHVVPVCFAVLDAHTLAFAIDDKPKAVGRTLRRVRNLEENPRFSLVVDRWSEDWRRLAYVLISGTAARASDARRCAAAVRALRRRYPQYRAMRLDPRTHDVVLLVIGRVHAWGRVGGARTKRTPQRRRRVAASARAARQAPRRSAI